VSFVVEKKFQERELPLSISRCALPFVTLATTLAAVTMIH